MRTLITVWLTVALCVPLFFGLSRLVGTSSEADMTGRIYGTVALWAAKLAAIAVLLMSLVLVAVSVITAAR